MKKIFFFLMTIAFLLIIRPTLATPLEYLESTILLDSSSADYTLTFLFQKLPEGTLNYPLPFHIKDFETSANFKNYTCEAEKKDWGTLITCDFSDVKAGGRALSIRFRREGCVKKIESAYHFDTNIKTPQKVPRMVVKIVLEKGFILIPQPEKPTTIVPFAPTDGTEGSDGRRIFIVWERNNLEKGEGIDVTVNYERSTPISQNNTPFIILGIAILVIITVLSIRFRGEREGIERILKDDERRIIEIIKSYGGSCKQREIVRDSDFSKAKVSRLIRDLEERKIIKVEKIGRTNRVYLLNNTSSI